MSEQEVIDIIKEAIYVFLIIGAPPMIVALVIGLMVSLFQALTQIQEMTLTFVPKMVAMLLTLIITMPFVIDRLTGFSERMEERIIHIGSDQSE